MQNRLVQRSRATPGTQVPPDAPHRPALGDRLFFALHPDVETARRIAALAEALRTSHHLGGKPIPATRMHVTLHFLGDHDGLPASLIAAAEHAARQVSMAPFVVRFDSIASFAGHACKRPCVLRNDDPDANRSLRALRVMMGKALRTAGLGSDVEARFTPHVTLLHDELAVAPEAVQPIEWTVRRFALVQSLLGRSEHRILFVRQLA